MGKDDSHVRLMKNYQIVRNRTTMLHKLMSDFKKKDPFKEALEKKEDSARRIKSPPKDEMVKVRSLFRKVQNGLE
jgi:hypothetical protein